MYYKRGVIAPSNTTTDIMDAAFEDTCRALLHPHFEGQCTSGIEGNHSVVPESGHYYGRSRDYGFTGRDVFTRDALVIPVERRDEIARAVQARLDRDYGLYEFLVLRESDHFHLQRRKGSV